jgi:hypothetical protein
MLLRDPHDRVWKIAQSLPLGEVKNSLEMTHQAGGSFDSEFEEDFDGNGSIKLKKGIHKDAQIRLPLAQTCSEESDRSD